MGRSALIAVIRHAGSESGEADAVLLGRFAASADNSAFAELVRRYARLVWGRCRSSLPCEADADDAFQATFLALAKHARTVRDPNRLGPWLHAVAGRVCKNARRAAARRTAREGKAAVREATRPVADSAWEQASAAVHEEVAKLPPSLRESFVICVLEGKTPTAAAEQLGLPWGTFSARLSRAKAKLLERLAARGIGAAVALAALTDSTAPAGTIERVLSRGASESVLSLVRGAVPMSVPSGRLLLAAIAMLGGMGVLLPGVAQEPPKAAPPKPPESKAKLDRYGDPLPDKAVMRLGTVQYRVPALVGVGFKKTGELVAVTEKLELHTFPADGGPKATVTQLLGKPSDGHSWRVAISPDARFAAAHVLTKGQPVHKVVVWDISGDKPVEHMTRDMQDAFTLAFAPDGSWFAASDSDRKAAEPLAVADLGKKKWKSLPIPPGVYVEQMAFNADGKRLAVTVGDTAHVFDTATDELLTKATLPRERLDASAVSPDGKAVAVQPGTWLYGEEKELRLLNVSDGTPVDGWTGPKVKGQIVGFTPKGDTLWVSGDRRLSEWDPKAGKWVHEAEVPVGVRRGSSPVWSADGKRFVTHNDQTIAVLDANTWKPLNADPLAAGPTDAIFGVSVSPDGKTIATDGTQVHLWDAATGKLLGSVKGAWGNEPMLAFLPDSESFITVVDRYVPVVFDARTGKELRRFEFPKGLVNKVSLRDLRLSADGKTLFAHASSASSQWKSADLQWDVKKGEVTGQREATTERDEVFAGTRSPDGEWLTSLGTLMRVDESAPPLEVIPQAEWAFTGAAWSADSNRIAFPRAIGKDFEEKQKDENNSITVFDVTTKSLLVELGTGKVVRSAFSADGKRLATMTKSKLVVWEVATGKVVFETACDPGGNTIRRRAIAFTPDGKRLITGHETHALVWGIGGEK